MKRNRISKSYIFIFLAILSLLSLSKKGKEKIQGGASSLFSPAWHAISKVKLKMSSKKEIDKSMPQFADSLAQTKKELTEEWEVENLKLKSKIENLHELLYRELYLLSNLSEEKESSDHLSELNRLIEMQLSAAFARVIFRSPASWNSSFWINVGTEDNHRFQQTVIAKNSPVISGSNVVGVIDYVGAHQSRVRLITDEALCPSVRALRGKCQDVLLSDALQHIIGSLSARKDLLESDEEKLVLINSLKKMEKKLSHLSCATHLAKGEIHGTSEPLWRSKRQLLKGVGFNYDFADSKGPARDLRTGQAIDSDQDIPAVPILRVGDLLVTTGMDGVFPPGLNVAQVVDIENLKEGDYTYELTAKPTCKNIDELSLVCVLPPLGYKPEDQPSLIGYK